MENKKTLLDPSMSTETSKKYNLPLTHFETEFISNCTDVKLLEKIYRVLKSGEEGCYPHLETLCEQKICLLNPKSRVLRKDNPLWTMRDLDDEEREQLGDDLENWTSDMQHMEVNFKAATTVETFENEETELPPIRSGSITLTKDGAKSSKPEGKSNKRVMPRDYREWDKVDVDKELEKIDTNDKTTQAKTVVGNREVKNIPQHIDTKGLTDSEKLMKAEREKDKGNEAFRAGDFKESIVYYTRSISLMPTAASYNNRALAYLKSEEWQKAVTDTNTVLKMEPGNVKALLRRGTAFKGLKKYPSAWADLQDVLDLEPKNKKAQELQAEVEEIIKKEKEEKKTKGRRMKIEDIDEVTEESNNDKADVVKPAEEKTKVEQEVDKESIVKKQPRRMQIVETDSDEEDEDTETVGQMNGEATDKEKTPDNLVNGFLAQRASHKEEKSSAESVVTEKKIEAEKAIEKEESVKEDGERTDSPVECKNDVESGKEDADEKGVNANESGESNDDSEANVEENVNSGDDENEEGDSSDAEEDEEKEEAPSLKRPVFYTREMPDNCVSLKEEATKLFKNGQYGEAQESYTKLITRLEKVSDQEVNLSLMYSNRAACQLKIGDMPRAVQDCTKSLELVPHMVKPLVRRASAYESLERFRLAYVDYRHVLSLDTRVDQAHLGLKRCQHHLQEIDGRGWREKIKLTNFSAWEIPDVIGLDGKPVATVVYTVPNTGSQSQPSSQPSSQSQTSSQSGNKSKASQSTSLSKSGSSAEVKTEKKEEKKPQPKKPPSLQEQYEALKSEGNEYVKKGKHRDAIKCYTQCIGLQPDQVVAYTNRALCYIRMNQPENAEEDCTDALNIEKANVKALFRRAQARRMLKKYREGVEDLKHLMDLEPKNSAAAKEMEELKRLWKKQLETLQKDLAQKKEEKNKAAAEVEKRRRKIQIQETDSEEEEEKETAKPETRKPKEQNSKPSPGKGPKQQPVKTGSGAKDKENSKPVKVADKSKTSQSSVKETSLGLPQVPKSVPKLEKATPYEFISAWNSLKKSDTVKPYYELLKQIKPADLKTMISNKLDGQMLNIITKCVSEFYMPNGEIDESYLILKNLSTVPRFGTNTMFMSAGEKSEVQSVMKKLEGHSSRVYTSADVGKLKKEYGV